MGYLRWDVYWSRIIWKWVVAKRRWCDADASAYGYSLKQLECNIVEYKIEVNRLDQCWRYTYSNQASVMLMMVSCMVTTTSMQSSVLLILLCDIHNIHIFHTRLAKSSSIRIWSTFLCIELLHRIHQIIARRYVFKGRIVNGLILHGLE